jgi:hypothetical protein
MRSIGATLLIVALFAGPAKAHEDRILHVNADGSIPAIPAKFGKARLIMAGLGTNRPFVQLRIGAHRTTLPSCVTQMIRTASPADVLVTGSWYHDEKASLPYYLDVQFIDPGYDPKRNYNAGHEFLFNLHNAKLIDATVLEATKSGDGGRRTALKLPPGCSLSEES